MYLNVLDKREMGFVLNILINASKTKVYQQSEINQNQIKIKIKSSSSS